MTLTKEWRRQIREAVKSDAVRLLDALEAAEAKAESRDDDVAQLEELLKESEAKAERLEKALRHAVYSHGLDCSTLTSALADAERKEKP